MIRIPNLPRLVIWGGAAFVLTLVALTFFALPLRTVDVQTGYSGTGMAQIINANTWEAQQASLDIPPEPWPLDLSVEGPLASEVYENVPVLGHLTADQFDRMMAAITEWVSPEQGCAYCHGNDGNFASDAYYTKLVARRMFQMTWTINSEWGENHVLPAGVNCLTCHRGQPVPANIWFQEPLAEAPARMIGDAAQQNIPANSVAMASLPLDPFTPFLVEDHEIRVIEARNALPVGNRTSIKQTEWTYGLMMHMSDSLGVNCTYCHNSRSFSVWEQSPPARVPAWHAIRMLREVNNEYLIPLQPVYPEIRLGALGDAPKANCATCHNGVYKPLFGANMVADYPSLLGPPAPEQAAQLDPAAIETAVSEMTVSETAVLETAASADATAEN